MSAKFRLDVGVGFRNRRPRELKHCNVCERPGTFAVTYESKDPGLDLLVRYCWKCLPSDVRAYFRANY